MMVINLQEENTDVIYSGQHDDYNELLQWMTEKCVPFVREVTFENAEVCLL
jgi:endoplasmic reticulum resident protein 44